MKLVSALFIGLLFGLGLIISGMVNPGKVLGFLDIFGDWDPSLAFVMGGAVVVTFAGFRWIGHAGKPWFDGRYNFPTASQIDSKLIIGAALFGIGWGLVGLCPGPALAGFLVEPWALLVFLAGMAGGMILPRLIASID
ncbi:UNVERIFIED_CONTAM: hypothetical protein GTU68_024817 [Idotea baltica]|nr:hypothetical protein [Idotea baltica]